jgi:hypothetical protein
LLWKGVANGLRYPRVGGVWIRFEGSINPKPEKSLENAADSHTSGARFVGRRFAKVYKVCEGTHNIFFELLLPFTY